MRAFAIILAAGRGERFGADKVLQNLGGRPVWKWSYDLFLSLPEISGVGLVCSSENIDTVRAMAVSASFVIVGGANRQESCRLGVEAFADSDVVLVHDAARPFVSDGLVRRVLVGIEDMGAAAPAVSVVDTLREKSSEGAKLLNRERIVAMQTPQGAVRDVLLDAHRKATELYTDEMALLEAAGHRVKLVDGTFENFKITTAQDLERARAMISGETETRTGLGYDVHRFSEDAKRPLFLGGIRFEEGPGLLGHSDADVIVHAAVDALLGAAALGDIGQHFPPSEERWKDEPSLTFLKHAAVLLKEAGWRIVNLDIAVIAEKPRIMSRSVEMRQQLSSALEISIDRVSVKATTNEGLGSIGRGEGISAFATATISRP